MHNDEVYFRDTAHGFLVWAVGMVMTAGFLASAAAAFAGSAQQTPTSGVAAQESVWDPNAYFVDTLLRPDGMVPGKSDADRAEVARTFAHDFKLGVIPPDDKAYLTQAVAARTGISPSDAEKRLTSVFTDPLAVADKARKALVHLSLWMFVALLSGAFCASYAGTIGGKQRDRVPIR